MPQRRNRQTKGTCSQCTHQPFRRNAIGRLLSKQASQISQAPAGIACLQQRLGPFKLQTSDSPLRSLALLNLAAPFPQNTAKAKDEDQDQGGKRTCQRRLAFAPTPRSLDPTHRSRDNGFAATKAIQFLRE